jgi:hypothetical protein
VCANLSTPLPHTHSAPPAFSLARALWRERKRRRERRGGEERDHALTLGLSPSLPLSLAQPPLPLLLTHIHTAHRYAADQRWLNKKHIIGRAVGYLPYVGMVTIIMNDYPYLKYALIGLLGIFVLTSRE